MTADSISHVVRLTQTAEDDYRDVLRWTEEQFGHRQALLYDEVLTGAISDLQRGLHTPDVKRREELSTGLYTLHVARNRRRGRHLILFRIDEGGDKPVVRVIRILHDSMDIARHVPEE